MLTAQYQNVYLSSAETYLSYTPAADHAIYRNTRCFQFLRKFQPYKRKRIQIMEVYHKSRVPISTLKYAVTETEISQRPLRSEKMPGKDQ